MLQKIITTAIIVLFTTLAFSQDNAIAIAEKMPEFPGGDRAFSNYINTQLQYPSEAKKNKISGTIYVKFIISATGSVTNVTIVRGKHPLLDHEAKRVVSSSPKWKPGIDKGKNVAVWYTVPVRFVLD